MINLELRENNLTGDVPGSFNNMINLCDPSNFDALCDGSYQLNLGSNCLKVPAPELPASFLAIKEPDW